MSSYIETARKFVPTIRRRRHETAGRDSSTAESDLRYAVNAINAERSATSLTTDEASFLLRRIYQSIGRSVPPGAEAWAAEQQPDLMRAVDAANHALDQATDALDRAAMREAAIALARAYEALIEAWNDRPAEPAVVVKERRAAAFTLIAHATELPSVLEVVTKAEVIGLDLETTGLNPRRDRARLLCLATGTQTYVLDLFPVLAQKPLLAHHALFDLSFLAALGFEPGAVQDTILLARLLSAGLPDERGYHSLAGVAERELSVTLPKELQQSDWSGELSQAQLEYAARDAAVLLPLHAALTEKIGAAGLTSVAEIEQRTLPAMVWMSGAGVPFDREAWLLLAEAAEREAARLEDELNALAPPPEGLDMGQGWNWGSPRECLKALHKAGFNVEDTEDAALAGCDAPFPELLRQYRGQTKLQSSYGQNWLERAEGARIYPNWQQIGSAAGRMSCREPNVQQVPRDPRYRACIAAPAGRVLVKADYSQIELRLAARIAGEKVMLAAYQREEDLHTLTARSILGREEVSKQDRQLAKAVNFGLLYGMGANRFRVYAAVQFGVSLSAAEAEGYRRKFFQLYPGLARWHRRQKEGEEEMRTLTGRRRLGVKEFTWKLNTPVQGSGADGLKRALALLWERRSQCPGAVPVIACHAEIVVECDEEQAEPVGDWLKQAMRDGMSALAAPVPVDVLVQTGRTWAG